MTDAVFPTRALISVSDKTGLGPLVRALAARGVELISTGGTAGLIRSEGLAVTEVSALTGLPEMLDGRVKTLHPAVHAGLLARRDDAAHAAAMAAHGFRPIDVLVVNLYPFEAALSRGEEPADLVEQIDVGGPAMLRAAAKNHDRVAVLCDPADYPAFLAELEATGGATRAALRRRLAAAAFARTAAYDAAIAGWLASEAGEAAPRRRAVAGTLVQTLRYGENPHQRAAFYADGSGRPGVATARQWQGKELSYNNILDTDAAFEAVAEVPPAEAAACVIVKHATPCAAARAPELRDAFLKAFDADRTSAFGGIVALNRPLDRATAEEIARHFLEVVIAPGAEEDARAALAGRGNLRLLTAGALPDARAGGASFRSVAGGFLVQDRDAGELDAGALRLATARAPSAAELDDLLFAWKMVKHVKSNAIVLVRGGATVGIGGGQTARVDAVKQALAKAAAMGAALGLAHSPAQGAVAASDAFFPFPDGIEALAAAGVTAVIQPGGAQRDAAVTAAADAAGMAMVLTARRHFRH
jgi:phosphoribosylaminoimidazolecarboxamide formyltransferase/IMP cyclohydrolase